MQLNSANFGHINWRDPATNIRAGCEHIKMLINRPETTTYWSVAIAYNAGINRIRNPPASTLRYADAVIKKFNELTYGGVAPILLRK